MKRPIAPPLLDQRVVRIITWATLWLVWAGAVLAGLRGGFRTSRTFETQRHRLKLVSRLVVSLLVFWAIPLVTRIEYAPRAYGPRAYRRVCRRAHVGGALRSRFRARTLLARIAKLSDALRHPEKYTRAIAARMMRNFTKVVRLYAPTFIVSPLRASFALSPATLDSS